MLLAGRVADRSDAPLGEPSLEHRHGCSGTIELPQRVTCASAGVLSWRMRLAERILPRRRISRGVLDPELAIVAEAFTRGRVSFDCAAQTFRTLSEAGLGTEPGAREIAERELIAAATGVSGTLREDGGGVRVMCRVWKASLDQDGAAPSETVPEPKRGQRPGTGCL